MGKVKTTRRLFFISESSVQRAPRRVCKKPARIFRGVSCVQRAPRRGNETTAQGKRPKGATPWVSPGSVRYAPGGGKSSDRRGQFRRRGCYIANRGVHIRRKIPSVIAFAPSGGVSDRMRPNPGCRSLRSLALGWGLFTPSGCSLNACVQNEIHNYIHETTEPNKNK